MATNSNDQQLRATLLSLAILAMSVHLSAAIWFIRKAPNSPASYFYEFLSIGFLIMGFGATIATIATIALSIDILLRAAKPII